MYCIVLSFFNSRAQYSFTHLQMSTVLLYFHGCLCLIFTAAVKAYSKVVKPFYEGQIHVVTKQMHQYLRYNSVWIDS